MKLQKQILIINDEPDLLNQMFRWLSEEGYGVECTHQGEKGIKLAKNNSYDLILLDYNLKRESDGEKTASDFIPQLVHDNPLTPIIVTSATVENISASKLGVSKVLIIDRSFWKKLLPLIAEELKN